MQVLLRHIHYPTRYLFSDSVALSREYSLALIRQPDLSSWLQCEDILVYGEAINIDHGSHMRVYGEMDRSQQLYFLLRWGSPHKEDITG